MSLSDLRHRMPRSRAWRMGDIIQGLEHAFERARADGAAENDARFRILIVAGVFSLIFAALVAGAVKAALFSGLEAPTARSGMVVLQRGDLTDRDGRLLAVNLPHYRMMIDPIETVDRQMVVNAVIRTLPDLPRTARRRLVSVLSGNEMGFIVGGLTAAERQAIHDLALGGLYFEEEDARAYPLHDLGAHLIGTTDVDGVGRSGVERTFDDEIRAAGQEGGSVALSIDLRIQGALEAELEAMAIDQQAVGAVGVVTNIQTGEVLGMASWPDYDPNDSRASPEEALRNQAASSRFEMGSTFKIFSITAGLDAGVVSTDTVIDAAGGLRLGGRVINDFHGVNRAMTVSEVFTRSSNIGTSRIAALMGADTMQDYYGRFGLLERMDMGLAESAQPLVPSRWDAGTLASASFGHAIGVTPLHMAAGVGAIMNGGVYVPLTLRPVTDRSRLQGRRIISGGTSRTMLDLMRLNVTDGSGRRADVDGLSVGGKTGTAELYTNGRVDRTRVLSSFVSVFPTDGPLDRDRYLVLILVNEPRGSEASGGARTAGFTAAPAAGRVIRRIAPFLGVHRQRTGEEPSLNDLPVSEEESMVAAR